MPKRKRGEEDSSDRSRGGAKQQRIDHKIAQGSIHLGHAIKVAKSFERQKLGRREKTARAAKNDKDVVRIEAEIAALKTLDTSTAAHLLLHKTLGKIKAVATSDLFTVYFSAPPRLLQDAASQNIYARLCNSKPVKEALAKLLEDLLDAAHIHAQKKPQSKQKSEIEQKPPTTEDEREQELESDGEEVGAAEIDDLNSEDFAEFDQRIADSDDESDEDTVDGEFDDIFKLERQLQSEGIQNRDDWSGSEDDAIQFDELGDDASESEDDTKPRNAASATVTKKTARALPASKATSSMLLPSLTMGGYISASDGSEAEDIDEKPRKNRPGQRARQAIWEKKYGTKAKHLQDTAKTRDKGWDMKRGATGGATRGGRIGRDAVRRDNGASGAMTAPKKPKKDDLGKLHPSWEAAKLAKEKKAATSTFAGKKISFD